MGFDNCEFHNNKRGDDFLNIIRSDFRINECVFYNTNADAFDSDFSVGEVTNSKFINCGNDAVDISGSFLTVRNVIINKTVDKGFSIGERSELKAKLVEISNSNIAIAAKDQSNVEADQVVIYDSNIAYTAFQKKPEYGPAEIKITSSDMTNVMTPFLIEKESLLNYNYEIINSNSEHLKELLYEVKND